MSNPTDIIDQSNAVQPFDKLGLLGGLYTQLTVPIILKWVKIIITVLILILPIFMAYSSVRISSVEFRPLATKLDAVDIPVQPVYILIFIIFLFGGYIVNYNLQWENLRKLSEFLDEECSSRDTLELGDEKNDSCIAESDEYNAVAYEKERNEDQNSNITDKEKKFPFYMIPFFPHDSIFSNLNDNAVREFLGKSSDSDKNDTSCVFISLDHEQTETMQKLAKQGIFLSRKIGDNNIIHVETTFHQETSKATIMIRVERDASENRKESPESEKVETPETSSRSWKGCSEEITAPLAENDIQDTKSSILPFAGKAKILDDATEKNQLEVKNLDTIEKNYNETKCTGAETLSTTNTSLKNSISATSKLGTPTAYKNADEYSEKYNSLPKNCNNYKSLDKNQSPLPKFIIDKKDKSALNSKLKSLEKDKREIKNLNTPEFHDKNFPDEENLEMQDAKKVVVFEEEDVLQNAVNLVSSDINISPIKELDYSEDPIFAAINETYKIDSGLPYQDTVLLPVLKSDIGEKIFYEKNIRKYDISERRSAVNISSESEVSLTEMGSTDMSIFNAEADKPQSMEEVSNRIDEVKSNYAMSRIPSIKGVTPKLATSLEQSPLFLKSQQNDQTEPKKISKIPMISFLNQRNMSKQNNPTCTNNLEPTTSKTSSIVKPSSQSKILKMEVIKKAEVLGQKTPVHLSKSLNSSMQKYSSPSESDYKTTKSKIKYSPPLKTLPSGEKKATDATASKIVSPKASVKSGIPKFFK